MAGGHPAESQRRGERAITRPHQFHPVILPLILLLATAAFGLTQLEEQLAVERSIKERIEETLRKFVGAERFQVAVSVELKTEATALRPVSEGAPQRKPLAKKLFPGLKAARQGEYLPGIPAEEVQRTRKTPDPGLEEEEPVTIVQRASIRRILVKIIIDDKVSEEDLDKIKSFIMEIIGMDVARGDVIKIDKYHFPEPPAPVQQVWWRTLIQPPQVYYLSVALLFLLTLVGLVLGPMRSTINRFTGALAASRESSAKTATGISPATLQAELGLGATGRDGRRPTEGAGGRDRRGRRLFGFVTEENLPKLRLLLKEASPEYIAIAASYLGAEIASRIISGLDPELQQKVMTKMAITRQLSPEAVTEVEQELKSKVEFLVGGVDQVVAVLDRVDPQVQRAVLRALGEHHPGIAAEVQGQILIFEDLAYLDVDALQAILREVGMDAFAAALKNTEAQFQDGLIAKFSTGAAAILRQAVELTGAAATRRGPEAQREVIQALRRLMGAGMIHLDRGGQQPAVEPAGGSEEPAGDGAPAVAEIPGESEVPAEPETPASPEMVQEYPPAEAPPDYSPEGAGEYNPENPPQENG